MVIKRVRVEDLRTGMYIHDLNCGWLQHGFLRQHFMLSHAGQIQKMRDQGMYELYIDTERGDDVAGAPTKAEIDLVLDQQLKQSAAAGAALPTARVSQKEESVQARKILGEASVMVDGLLQDVRLGKSVDPAKAGPLVKEINASVLRNPGGPPQPLPHQGCGYLHFSAQCQYLRAAGVLHECPGHACGPGARSGPRRAAP